MTPERALELLPVIKAYSEGKRIEGRASLPIDSLWIEIPEPQWVDRRCYRIMKQEIEIFVWVFETTDEIFKYGGYSSKAIAEEALNRWCKEHQYDRDLVYVGSIKGWPNRQEFE